MKRITTPVLHKINDGGGALLASEDEYTSFCLDGIEDLWHIPESAERLWLEIVPRPQTNSIEVKLRMWKDGHGVEWRMGTRDTNEFEASWGLADLLREHLSKRRWTTFNVRLLYE